MMETATFILVVLAVLLFLVAIAGLGFIGRMARDVSAIQRAIFLQLRKQYADIDSDLKELADLVKTRA